MKKEKIFSKYKDSILKWIFVFCVLAITIFGLSFAWYSFTNPNIDVSGVTSNWCSGLDVTASGGNLTNADLGSPVAAYNTGNREPSTNFTITNNETRSVKIDISLIDISMDGALKSEYFMYTLTDGTNVISEGNFSNVNLGNGASISLKKNLTLSGSSSKTYYLYLWIKDNGGDQNDMQNKTFSGNIKVNISSSFCDSGGRLITFANQQNPNSVTVGDEIVVDTEHFYVISLDGNKVTLLAKYNLNVGYNKNPNVIEGIQDESVRGYISENDNYGSVDFADNWYWLDQNNELVQDYADLYVYDYNSNIYDYVEDYTDRIKQIGFNTANGRLLKGAEAYALDHENQWWDILRLTSFWLGTVDSVYNDCIETFSPAGGYSSDDHITVNLYYGVRPVIEISMNEFYEQLEIIRNLEFVNRQNENSITVGDELAIDTEHFYVVSSDSNETVLLAKYNLYVGSEYVCDPEDCYIHGEADSQNDRYGLQTDEDCWTVPFSNTNYWVDNEQHLLNQYGTGFPAEVYDNNSVLYQYVENYVLKLEEMGLYNIEGRVLTYNEVRNLDNNLEWLHSTNYWLGTVQNSLQVYSDSFNSSLYHIEFINGVRPVIVVSTSSIS